jgi:hypothetical protein
MDRVAAVIAVAVCVVALGATAADARTGAAKPAPPRDFFGLVSEDAFQVEGAYRQTTLATQSSLGVGLLRETFDWSKIEVSPGTYDFRWYDQFVADTARAGIAVLPIVFRTPTFRGGVPGVLAYPPTNYADRGEFATVSSGATARPGRSGPRIPACPGCRSAPGRSGTSRT